MVRAYRAAISLRPWRSSLALLSLGLVLGAPAASHYNPSWGPFPPVPPHSMNALPSQRVVKPMIFPVIGESHWNDDYTNDRGGFRHAAIDIKAPKMSPIVAPFSGTIGFKTESFWIFGDDGWAMLGTHLNDDSPGKHDHAGGMDVMFAPNLIPGQHVRAGQFIGYVGMSGNATGPHLHFELYAPGGGPTAPRVRNPFLSLKTAQVLTEPRVAVSGPRPAPGEIRFDGCLRRVDRSRSEITLLLTDKETSNGHASCVLGPHYVRFKLNRAIVGELGGWEAIRSIPESEVLSCYLPAGAGLDDAALNRVIR